jgi:hypothetical protein
MARIRIPTKRVNVQRVAWMVALAGFAGLAGCGGGSSEEKTAQATATQTAAETPTPTATPTAGTEQASSGSTKRPDEDGDGTPDPQTFRGSLGDTFTLVGQPSYKKAAKDALKVTVLGLKGPFSGFDVGSGKELIGLEVRFVGVGSKAYSDPQPSGELTLSSGETGKPTSLITGSGTNPCDAPSLKLTKGKSVTACLAFEVVKNAKPRVFQYAADNGYGDTGVWKLK